MNPGSNVTDPEGACEQVIFSGGGFSNYFAIPSYQKTAVASYLKKYKPAYSYSECYGGRTCASASDPRAMCVLIQRFFSCRAACNLISPRMGECVPF